MMPGPSLSSTSVALLLLALLLLGSLGCENPGPPRELPAPAFDARTLFENLSSSARSSTSQEESFEDRITQMMAEQAGPETASTRSVQQIPLGASLSSELPDDFEAWRWSRKGQWTLISYRPPGEAPQIVLATRDYSLTSGRTPARELDRFINDIAPGLGLGFNPLSLVEQAARGDLPIANITNESGEVQLDDLLAAIAGENSLTGGRGLGFRPAPESFSGWKWGGTNDAGLYFRFASTRGIWGAQPTTPPGLDPNQLASLLGAAAEHSSTPPQQLDIDGALNALQGLSLGGSSSGAPTPGTPASVGVRPERIVDQGVALPQFPQRTAQLYLGMVESSPARGIYVVLLCAAEGDCPEAANLAAFLQGIEPSDTGTSGRQTDFSTHATSLGLRFLEAP